MINWQHYGLTFAPDAVNIARTHRSRPPYQAAWVQLEGTRPIHSLSDAVQWAGLRWRFLADSTTDAAIADLTQLLHDRPEADAQTTLYHLLTLAQAIELLRDHPSLHETQCSDWLTVFGAQVNTLTGRALPEYAAPWYTALILAAGAILEDSQHLETGAAAYRQQIEALHPTGYVPTLVEGGSGFAQTVQYTAGLVLSAEIAQHVGLDLWAYANRGVSVVTAGLYPLYYFYYPEQWPWHEGLTEADTQGALRHHAGYLEMLNAQIGRPTRALDLVLDELRPIYDPVGGGLVTLTHGVMRSQGVLSRLFGRKG